MFLYSCKIEGFINAWIFFILFPSIIFLTASSTIFPFFVLGISETSIIFFGTWRGDAFWRIAFFNFRVNFSLSVFGVLRTMNKIDVHDFIVGEKFVVSAEFYFGVARFYVITYICEDHNGNVKAFDLRNDPSHLVGLDYPELKETLLNTTPKILRTVIKNRHPILMEGEFSNRVKGYETIGFDELNSRVKVINENDELTSKIKRFILENNKENEIDQLDKEPEESIYTFGFTNQLEKSLMQEFHEVDWDKKIEISKKFIDLSKKDFNSIQRGKIYNEFSKILLYEENQKILDFEEKQRIKRKLSKRVFYPDTDTVKSPWNNINRAFMEVENLGIKLEDEGNKEDLEFLYKIKDLLEKIEKEFK